MGRDVFWYIIIKVRSRREIGTVTDVNIRIKGSALSTYPNIDDSIVNGLLTIPIKFSIINLGPPVFSQPLPDLHL